MPVAPPPAVSADKTAGAVAGSFDESSIARVADSPATDPHDPNTSVVERGNWKMILPAELTASAVPGEAPPAVETSSSTSETSKASGGGDSPSGDSPSGDSPSGDSPSAPGTDGFRSTDVAAAPSPVPVVTESRGDRRSKKKKGGKVRFVDEEEAVAAEVRARRKAAKAAAAVAKAAGVSEVKYLYRGNKPSFAGPDPLPATATSGRTRVPHAVMYPGRERDAVEPKPEPKIPARVVPLMTVYDLSLIHI